MSTSSAAKPRPEAEHVIKVLIIGDSGVGKSCLLMRFADAHFTDNFISTIGIDFKVKQLEVEDAEGKRRRVKLQIWDTAGQERFRTITAAYYRNASAVMLAYDCTNAASFDAVSGWLRGLSAAIGDGSVTELVKALVATKCDSPAAKRVITQQEGAALAEVHAMRHYETSAKTGWGVDEAFTALAADAMAAQQRAGSSSSSPPQGLPRRARKSKASSGCC